jgi:MSHA biogenesis protein MshI
MTFLSRFSASGPAAWTVVAAGSGQLRYVRGSAGKSGKPRVLAFGEAELKGEKRDLARAAKELRIPRAGPRATLLDEVDYRIHMVEAPSVPASELKAAMKWRLKEIIDFPVEEAGYDILDLPADRRGAAQAHNVYAIAAKKEVLKGYVERFDKAGLSLSVIDIPETAQRNIAALYEEEHRAVALLYLDDADGLLTVSSGGELYLARRLDISLDQIRKTEGDARYDLFNRILLELQRTLDNFERQFSFVVIGKLMLGPEPEDTGLLDYLVANLGIKVEPVELQAVIEMPKGHELDSRTQWRLFHLIGCSFRTESPVQ